MSRCQVDSGGKTPRQRCLHDAGGEKCLDVCVVGGTSKGGSCSRTPNTLALYGWSPCIFIGSDETLIESIVCIGTSATVVNTKGRRKNNTIYSETPDFG